MRSALRPIFIIVFMVSLLFSCRDHSVYCAKCKEEKTGIDAQEFCGDSQTVYKYVQDIREKGKRFNQVWKCVTTIK